MLQSGEPGHMSNECPKRRPVNMADYEDEDEVLIGTELEDSNFVEEGEASPAWSGSFYTTKKASDFLLKVFGKEQCV